MHLRFDGRLGFPGGLIDKVDNSIILYLIAGFYYILSLGRKHRTGIKQGSYGRDGGG